MGTRDCRWMIRYAGNCLRGWCRLGAQGRIQLGLGEFAIRESRLSYGAFGLTCCPQAGEGAFAGVYAWGRAGTTRAAIDAHLGRSGCARRGDDSRSGRCASEVLVLA